MTPLSQSVRVSHLILMRHIHCPQRRHLRHGKYEKAPKSAISVSQVRLILGPTNQNKNPCRSKGLRHVTISVSLRHQPVSLPSLVSFSS
jgi:hypothetical protein